MVKPAIITSIQTCLTKKETLNVVKLISSQNINRNHDLIDFTTSQKCHTWPVTFKKLSINNLPKTKKNINCSAVCLYTLCFPATGLLSLR